MPVQDRHFLHFRSHSLGPHKDYKDIIYDKAFNESFYAKLESLQCNTTPVITEATGGSSSEKSHEKRGLQCLKSIPWYRKMSFLYKVLKNESPSYLFNTMLNSNNSKEIQATFPLSLLNMIILRILFSLLQ